MGITNSPHLVPARLQQRNTNPSLQTWTLFLVIKAIKFGLESSKRAGFLHKPGIYQTAKIMVGFTDLRSIRAYLKPGQKSWKVLILWTQARLQSCPCSSGYGTSNGEGTGSPSGDWDEFRAGDLQAKKMRNEETAKQADNSKKCKLIYSEILDFFLLKNPQQWFLILGSMCFGAMQSSQAEHRSRSEEVEEASLWKRWERLETAAVRSVSPLQFQH